MTSGFRPNATSVLTCRRCSGTRGEFRPIEAHAEILDDFRYRTLGRLAFVTARLSPDAGISELNMDFSQYLRRRGFEPPWDSPGSLKRWFLTSFTQPGFARFWRLWNPPIGFILSRLYRKLGGDKNRVLACLGTFAGCGVCHDIFVLVLRRKHALEPQWTIAFLIYGLIVLLTSPRAVLKVMRKVPWPINVALNFTCLLAGIFAGDFVCDYFGL